MKKRNIIAYIFSGLPGVGKSSLAQMLSNHTRATYIRIDTIEYFLKKSFSDNITTQGYDMSYLIAKDNLRLCNNVIIDCCNPISESRDIWGGLSSIDGVQVINIEIICSNRSNHKQQVDRRYQSNRDKYPSWQDVTAREYYIWDKDSGVIKIDNSDVCLDESFSNLLHRLKISS